MDADEVLRLCQISGLAEAFENEEFSEAWVSQIFDESLEVTDIDFENGTDLS